MATDKGVSSKLNLVYSIATGVLLVLYVWVLYNIPILAVGVRHLRRLGLKGRRFSSVSKERLPMVSIIVPVKEEEKVVARLLEALLRVNYPPEKREIVIVEDGSEDKTVEICRAYVRKYPDQIKLVHQPTSSGKPSALNYGLKHVKGEIVAVFDADSVPEPDTLLKAVEHFEDPSVTAIQGRACSINSDVNMLTKFISYEEAVRYETYIRGKDALNLFVPLTGSCYFIRRSALLDVNGWDNASLSEDVEIALKLTKEGYRIKYAPEIRYWQENPVNLAQLIKQRIRWFRGEMEIAIKYGKLVTKPNRKNIDAEMTLLGPYMFILCLLSYFMLLQSFIVPAPQNFGFTAVNQITFLITVVPLFLIGVALIYVTKPRRAANLLWLPFIYAYWILQNFLALYALLQIVLRRPRKWTKTVKNGITCSREFKERLLLCVCVSERFT
jgi:cellulose synthase/poly-beta-1,6-N-acetylglucosamine synthase-like glycosyltransferase